jgi:mannose-6-phosphate isomerase-like protein (cupin superfamily)
MHMPVLPASAYPRPHLIEFPRLGEAEIGFISVLDGVRVASAEGAARAPLPFGAERVFWTYHTPETIVRGRHAHYRTEQVLLALAGRILVTVELPGEPIETFRLDEPHLGLYIPPCAWHTLQYAPPATIQLVFASTAYDEADYIRDYDLFRAVWPPISPPILPPLPR